MRIPSTSPESRSPDQPQSDFDAYINKLFMELSVQRSKLMSIMSTWDSYMVPSEAEKTTRERKAVEDEIKRLEGVITNLKAARSRRDAVAGKNIAPPSANDEDSLSGQLA